MLGDRRERFLQNARDFAYMDIGNGEKALFYHPATPPKGLASIIPTPPRFVVPGSQRRHLLELFHSSHFGGHSGVKRTLGKLQARYYWPKMYQDVTNHISCCETCQQIKAEHHPTKEHPGIIPFPSEPWELVSLDYAGPFPGTKDVNTAAISSWRSIISRAT